jgi:site-specific DNA-methyltransferase (adenine-specific)
MSKSEVHLIDCIEFMRSVPDKFYSLAVVDPPYGIEKKISTGGGSHTKSKSKFHQLYKEKNKSWDTSRPEKIFWQEIFRVSENQVVFGANYFTENLPISSGWAYWHKQGENMSSVNDELIWTSFDISIKIFSRCHGLDKGFLSDHKVFHPTTKPIALYDWIFRNYAKPNDTILDTHMGSQSSRISAYKAGLDFTGCELDPEYFEQGNERFRKFLLKSGTTEPDKAMPGQQINLF